MSQNDDSQARGGHGHQQYQKRQRQQQVPHQHRQPAQQQVSVPLIGDEEVVVDARPAWSAYSLQLIIAAVVLLGGLAAGSEGAVVGGIIAAGIGGYVYYQRQKTRYVVTDRRMMIVRGISSKSTNEAWMQDIRGLQTGASLIERLLGHGHIVVSAQIAPTGLSRFRGMRFGGIGNYEEVAQKVRERQNDVKME